ncbi:MAG: AraC family transcriptional regulator [Candidatus Binatia bacterium]|nr:AraC family transcriptional regulator [Candidatus Binatia bacterium]
MIPAMANPGVAPGGVRVPPGSRDWLLPLGDPRALVLRNLGVWLAGISEVRRGFDWPGTRADTHLVLGSIAGSGTLEVAGKNRVLSPGTLVLSPAGLPRRYFTRAARWRLLMVRVADLSRWHHLRDDGVRAFSDPWLTRLRAPMEGMLAEDSARTGVDSHTKASCGEGPKPEDYLLSRYEDRMGFGSDVAARSSNGPDSFQLHATILRNQLETMLQAEGPRPTDDTVALVSLWSRVREHPHEAWGTQDIAEAMGVSRATLHRLVRRHHGVGPGQIVENIRMAEAKRLLADSRHSIQVIADQVGYASAFSFSAAFKRVVGKSPSAFRDAVSS